MHNNTWVKVCVNAASPFLSFSAALNCTTGTGGSIQLRTTPAPLATSYRPPAPPAAFFQGYPLSLSAVSRKAHLIIPYPETDNWYLSLQLMCPQSPE